MEHWNQGFKALSDGLASNNQFLNNFDGLRSEIFPKISTDCAHYLKLHEMIEFSFEYDFLKYSKSHQKLNI